MRRIGQKRAQTRLDLIGTQHVIAVLVAQSDFIGQGEDKVEKPFGGVIPPQFLNTQRAQITREFDIGLAQNLCFSPGLLGSGAQCLFDQKIKRLSA